MVVVIMAGGGGSRLWPLSRKNKPKQFLDLGSGKTLLEDTWNRALALSDPSSIYIATAREYEKTVRSMIPDLPRANLLIEPCRRDTGPAFAAAACSLRLLGKEHEPTTFMWSDHVFSREQQLIRDLSIVPQLIQKYPRSIVIVGHRPEFPETGLGYIQVGNKVLGYENVFHVKEFKEKPDEATAKHYVADGSFYWNMAYISLTPALLFELLEEHSADLMKGISSYSDALLRGDVSASEKHYCELESISIDYALLEHASDIIAITGDYGWSDVGNWSTVKDIFGINGDHMPRGHHVHVGSNGTYIYNATDKAVTLVGMKNTIVVVTDDAILVTDKDSVHLVKDAVKELEKAGKDEYL